MIFSEKSRLPIVWSAIVLAAALFLSWQVYRGLTIETNFLELLPETEKDPVFKQADQHLTQVMEKKIVFLVGHPAEDRAIELAENFGAQLKRSGNFSIPAPDAQGVEKSFYDFFFPQRFQMLADDTRHLLESPRGAQALIRENLDLLYGPMSGFVASLVQIDPFFLFPRLIKNQMSGKPNLYFQNGHLIAQHDQKYWVVLEATLVGNPFRKQDQQAAFATIHQAFSSLQDPNLELHYMGLIRFAALGADKMHHEVSIIGLGSIIGILLLILFNFRSPRFLWVSLVPIAIGILCGLVGLQLIYGKLHIFTLAFGASVIGVCIDYSLQYFAEYSFAKDNWQPWQALKRIFPGITLGALTTITGYLVLAANPFPGLNQMAIFSSIGLTASYLTVVCLLPALLRKKSKTAFVHQGRLAQMQIRMWHKLSLRSLMLFLLALTLFSAWGMSRLKTDDDIRHLQPLDASLTREQKLIQDILGKFDDSRFLIVEGQTTEDLLIRQENLIQELKKLENSGKLSGIQSISNFIPSRQRQESNAKLLQHTLLDDRASVTRQLTSFGFKRSALDQNFKQMASAAHHDLTLEDWLANSVSKPFRYLWLGKTQRGVADLIFFQTIEDDGALEKLAAVTPRVTYSHKVKKISHLMRDYRITMTKWVIVGYLAIYGLFIGRYGWKKASAVMAPPVLGAALTLGLMGFFAAPLHLFNLLALVLVLAVGVDYSIFFAEEKKNLAKTSLAVFLSALTTLLSFGLLAVSQTPVLRSMGLTLLSGVLVSVILAPLPLKFQARPKKN